MTSLGNPAMRNLKMNLQSAPSPLATSLSTLLKVQESPDKVIIYRIKVGIHSELHTRYI